MKREGIIIIGILILVLASAAFFDLNRYLFERQNQEVVSGTVLDLQKQIGVLRQQVKDLSADQKLLAEKEAQPPQVVREKSQDDLLTSAVASVSPSVVSIVISKEVPNLSVVYENPFGTDPRFKNFGFKVPTFRQNGTTQKRVGAGTGFLITSDGYLLTNRHVVYDHSADYTVLLADGSKKSAKVAYLDLNNDVAIVKVEGTFKPAQLGDSGALKLGQSVIAIGNALGEYSNSVSVGIISGLDRSIRASGSGGTETLTGVIQTDAAINPGNSGGPLIDLNGRVVGINVATVMGSNSISFSIPINTVKGIIKQVIGR